jgi:CO/xanthine dehydrogenase Mo-binding subunit
VVAEVNDSTALGVSRLVVCVDTGRVVALDGVRNQVEGGAIQAASWTLKEAVRARDGAPPLDWDQYPILRFSEVPIIETIVLDRTEAPSLGVGECTQGPVAAAIANAFAAAYGVRIRDLPITRERVLAALQE